MSTERYEEENHLNFVYQKLKKKEREVVKALAEHSDSGKRYMNEITDGVSLDMTDYSNTLETMAQVEMKNREIDQLNLKYDQLIRLEGIIQRLLKTAYFARIDVQFDGEETIEKFYIGSDSFKDDDEDNLVIDWRAPIAELYYNQDMGETSFIANQREISVDLQLRRQFQIESDRLIAYFDSAVAIQDELLLEVLSQNKSEYMQDITATIQKEQNQIIRDVTSRVLLVNGIAGSGKTSAVLQRIAYLLYQYRNEVRSEDMLLLAPNPIFLKYISQVLPGLGEKNPLNMTMYGLIRQKLSRDFTMAPEQRQLEVDNMLTETNKILNSKAFFDFMTQQSQNFEIDVDFLFDIKRNEKILFTKADILNVYCETPQQANFSEKTQIVAEKLSNLLLMRLRGQAKSDKMYNRILSMSEVEQEKYFGRLIENSTRQEVEKLAFQYLTKRYRKVRTRIKQCKWLNIEALFKKLYQQYTNTNIDVNFTELDIEVATVFVVIEHLFMKPLVQNNIKFVLVDEAQDYSEMQVALLISLFNRAKFTLLGDENQAIFARSIDFEQLSSLFQKFDLPVVRKDLLISYRSNGPITEIFNHLAKTKNIEVEAVQVDGEPVVFRQFNDGDDYLLYLTDILRKIDKNSSTVVITKSVSQARKLEKVCQGKIMFTPLDEIKKHVPTSGISFLPIGLAKGLEFDNVIIHNANQINYQNNRDRLLLYTAASRAMKRLFIISIGQQSALF
ncbi:MULTISPECIES: UvrD-helicase domain-containing protein [unclassified Enterococcus]|uniref:HelD family protein n=1 Tax=unclassified Enterococcus TaxID=2608891 RepID=UPI001555499F|nr:MULTISPECIES: UvrD-helicase domain-containing protein [unclassified Enterococcus]MBS7577775.1 UvrD-helicase domain-containing protein [Enterococcus sp. MMGLQ5-2]MBS7585035.1 UvrD-helicase domain-containing protein [Enterococcus sp. MMGLQ5-1]NPD12891.1 UvrD-helicase domain-containing protein [Enterococcus sp. MMGLQ5-1]NPD37605.1 UvrD-helicase domain-containing protein [Enterococcus sp. MMGLQ5-2]